MITVYATETDYNELATGQLDMTAEQWMSDNDVTIDDLVAIDGDELVFHVEWGNGEGHDVYHLGW